MRTFQAQGCYATSKKEKALALQIARVQVREIKVRKQEERLRFAKQLQAQECYVSLQNQKAVALAQARAKSAGVFVSTSSTKKCVLQIANQAWFRKVED